MENKDKAIEEIFSFIDDIDEMLGAKPEEEIEKLFYEFASKSQPHAMSLLLAIDDAYENEGDFLGEAIVLTYCLHKFYKDRLHLSPLQIEEDELDEALSTVEDYLENPEAKQKINQRDFDEISLLSGEIPGYFLRIFIDILDDLADEGSINSEIWLDLFSYYLSLLRVFDQKFPQAHI